jgi:hypothetical protein
MKNLHPKTSSVKSKNISWMSHVLSSLNVANIWGIPKMSKAQKLCALEQKLSCKLPKKERHSLSMIFPHQMLNRIIMKFLPNIKNARTCLKRKTLTPYQSIVDMIASLILKRDHNLHSGQSTTYHKMNLQLFVITSIKTLKMGSFDIPSL